MKMPDFHNPAAFLLLFIIPLLYILRKAGVFTRLTLFSTISDWGGKTFEWDVKRRRIFSMISTVFLCIGFVLVVLALAEPVRYKQERVYTSRGTDIMFVLDVSPSMAARDIAGNRRIDAAKQAVQKLVSENSGASFGLVTMAGEAAVIAPPTVDHPLFVNRLNEVQIGSLGDGTALGTGLCTAVYHLSSSSAPKKCIVLVTDGENNAGAIHPETAAELAARNNITIYTLGIGTEGSVPIDYIDPKTGKNYSGYLNSTFDTASLRQISLAGGGRCFEVRSLTDLSLALSVISRNESTVQSYHSKTTGVELYENLLLAACICFIASWVIKRLYLQEPV